MRHDELLTKIGNGTYKEDGNTVLDHQNLLLHNKALRAVVEATQLKNPAPISPAFGDGWRIAMATVLDAIEKELK